MVVVDDHSSLTGFPAIQACAPEEEIQQRLFYNGGVPVYLSLEHHVFVFEGNSLQEQQCKQFLKTG